MRHSHVRPRTFSRDIRSCLIFTGKSIYAPDVVDGAIELYEESRWGLNSQIGGGRFCNFDASQSNSKFGLSDSIQPYSAYTFMIIKA